jgi:branched-subunit amino acid transport protein
MTTLVVMASAGLLTWLLRATFIVLVPSKSAAARVAAVLRYGAPAAFASIVAVSVTSAANRTDDALWRYGLAIVITAAAAYRLRNLAVSIAIGAGAITLLTLF